MRVGFDVASLESEQLTGIGVATKSLYMAMGPIENTSLKPMLKISRFRKADRIAAHIGARPQFFWPWKNSSTPEIDVFHGPDFRLPRWSNVAKVVTVHDLVEFQTDFNTPEFVEHAVQNMKRMIENCRPDVVIVVSEFTKNEFLRHFPTCPAAVTVVPHGADHLFPSSRQLGGPTFDRREKVVLSVGTLERRKNVGRLIEAFIDSGLPQRGYRLKLVGKKGFGAEAELAKAQHPSIDVLGFVSNETLRELYRTSAIFALPSLYEGFGLPLLEAMAWRLPVLTSESSACAEVARDAALLVNPLSIQEIAAALNALAAQPDLSLDLRYRGSLRSKEFTWANCAQKSTAAYEEALLRFQFRIFKPKTSLSWT